MDKNDEEVYCLRTSDLAPYSSIEGFCFWTEKIAADMEKAIWNNGEYKRRGDVEDDPSYQQIIPQVALISNNKIAIHRIPETGNEARLHGLIPMFFGGHMDLGDQGLVWAAAMREFEEETGYDKTCQFLNVGFVNLNDTDVNRVHFGIVYVVNISEEGLPPSKDSGVSQIHFYSWGEAQLVQNQMTPWSKVAFPAIRSRFEEV